jgi:hypothetical protein
MHGEGQLVCPNGNTYTGSFVRGTFIQGQGDIQYAAGELHKTAFHEVVDPGGVRRFQKALLYNGRFSCVRMGVYMCVFVYVCVVVLWVRACIGYVDV